jgi:hypothetical protein
MSTHEHLEHAEHAEHHASDPFNQRVAVSMAIIAACLAGISMVGHRTHNDVLQLLGDANQTRTEAATAEVEKSNLFAWYQSKRSRQLHFETSAKLAELAATSDEAARKKAIDGWKEKAAEYNKTNEAKDNLPDLQEKGAEASKRAESLIAKSAAIRAKADHIHHQADRLDIAHLLAEVALVVSSIALLTKKKIYWFAGILAAVVALSVTASAYMIPEHPHAPPAADTKDKDAHGH